MPSTRHPTSPLHPTPSTATRALRPTALVLACAAALLALVPMGDARAQPQATAATAREISVALPAQPLAQTINALARLAGVGIGLDTSLAAGRNAPATQGTMTLGQALERALAGSGLVATGSGSGVSIRRADAPGAMQSLAPVTVTAGAERENATGPVRGHVARRSATGTKTDTPLIETPQSVSVVGAELIETLKAQDITEALGYTAGVAKGDFADRVSNALVVRGFELFSTHRDGLKFQLNYFDGQQEPYGLERIEVLKGAASVLYGTARPGGLVNTVSKRPTAEPLREINLELGSFGRKQVSVDFGGALTADGVWTYRLTALQRKSDTFIDFTPDDRSYLAPALKWQPDAATALTILSEFQDDHTAYTSGLPAEGTVLPNPNGQLPRNRFTGEPGYDKYDIRRHSVGYLFEHAFTSDLKLKHSLRRSQVDSEWAVVTTQYSRTAPGYMADMRTINRTAEDRVNRSVATNADTALSYTWGAGTIENTTLIGLDYSRDDYTSRRFSRSVGPLNLFAPAYGGTLGNPVLTGSSSDNVTRQLGLYLQNQMKIAGKWVLLLGGRQDRVTTDSRNLLSGAVTIDNQKSQAFTGRAGLVYLADNGLAPFASFAQSFEPVTGFDRLGNRFKPTEGEQYEIGIRFQPRGSESLFSAALYQLTQLNGLVGDPVNTSFQIQRGEVRSRGLELEASTPVGRHTRVLAAYAYTDTRTTQSSPLTPASVGRRIGGVPYNQFSARAEYSLGAFGMPGLRLGAGLRFVDATRNDFTELETPSFTLLDAVASYTTGPWKLALNVSNLTDKTYAAVCPSRCFYGEPRKVVATMGYRW